MDEGKRLGSAGDFMHVCHELTPVPSWNQVTKRLWPFRGWKREQSKATRGRTPWKKTKEDCQSASGGDRRPQRDLSPRSPGFGKHSPGGPGLLRNRSSWEVPTEMHACYLGPGFQTRVHTRVRASQPLRQPRGSVGSPVARRVEPVAWPQDSPAAQRLLRHLSVLLSILPSARF